MSKEPNPAEEVKVTDLFRKDPEEMTVAEITEIVNYYRAQRAKFQAMEGKPKKKKATKEEGDPLDIKMETVK